MALPKNSPEILDLSDDAQAILAGYWAHGMQFSLVIGNTKSRLTGRAKAAIQELVSEGIINDDPTDVGDPLSRTYTLSSKGASYEFRKSMSWMEKNGSFTITEKI